MGIDQFVAVQASVIYFSKKTSDNHRNDELSVLVD